MRVKLFAPVLLGFAIAAACGGKNDTSQVEGGSAGTGSGTAASGNGTGTGGTTGLNVGTGGSSATGNGTGVDDGGAFDPDAACVGTAADGEPIPVDLFFMVDITGSMNCPVPDDPSKPPCEVQPDKPFSDTTRWTVESAALKAFVADPANKGLGMGIRFFPSTDKNIICDAATYVKPAVEIGALPGAATALNVAIDAQKPSGNTPTEASLDGALQHAAAWAKANPTHRVAVVYATDGYPKGCDGDSIDAAAGKAKTAFDATPSIPTYVLGVGPNLTALQAIADAGSAGKTPAFLVDTSKDAATQLSAALATIRTTAVVGCTYTVPPPPAGMILNPNQVNVQYTDPTGKVTNFGRDDENTPCDMGMGWQYSADMSQINLCGSACAAVKAASGGSVQVRFGCDTQPVNPPK